MAEEKKESPETPEDPEERVTIKYQKSPQHRTIHVTGAFGGTTPDGHEVRVQLFHESEATPASVRVRRKDLSETEKDYGGDSPHVIREIEVSAFMRPDVAFSLGQWLIQKALQNPTVAEIVQRERAKSQSNRGDDDE